jgi:hypothetical protein
MAARTRMPRTLALVVSMCLVPTACPAVGAETERPVARVLDEIRSHRSGIALWWVGNAGWLVKADGLLVGIDLDLESEERIAPPPVSAEELAGEIDVAFATHHHGDHFNAPTLCGPCMPCTGTRCSRCSRGSPISSCRSPATAAT